ncbi:hypothetical protein [Candidatus Thiodiazotropha sp. CDECU1]|uniref:hypothetical protein n=1 Tax=Candidatus Thiodiazotropha sp. CDECU1 TaxID=3065865 RepID=UPI00292EA95A|nr:hypothetical protein [Candidatus Thiodiazotropha sp. CDECU1]
MSKFDRAVAQGLGEQSIDAALYEQRREHEERLIQVRGQYKEACDKAEALRTDAEEQEPPRTDISSVIEALLAQAREALSGLSKTCARAAQILEAFRLRHGLTRAPAQPQAATASMVLSLLVFVEAAANAAFFANAHMVAGPFAALQTSVLISLTNVSVSALGGYLIGRWMDYGKNAEDERDPAFSIPRLRARIALAGLIGILGWFHMTVGLVRATESLDIVHHSVSSYALVLTTPESLFLVLTGACLSVLAYRKGKFSFDDPYPGYGTRSRALQTLRDEVVDAYEDFREQIEERFDEAQRDAAKAAKSGVQGIVRYNAAVKACRAEARKLEEAVKQAESTMRMQAARLTSHHRAARGRRSAVSENDLTHLLVFDDYLPDALPVAAKDSHEKASRVHFAAQKADALAQITSHYQSLLNDKEDMR